MNINFGDSTVVLTSKDYNKISQSGEYLFENQIQGIKKKVNEISNYINNGTESGYQGKLNNTIAIVGERGSGKSSLMGTTRNILEAEGYYCMDVIDPSIFDDSLTVLEIFLSGIFDKIKSLNGDIDEYQMEKVFQKAKTMMDTLSYLNLKKDTLTLKTDSDEFIDNVNKRINFGKSMKELIDSLKELIRCNKGKECKGIILFIDDLDMVKYSAVYNMLEDIRNYMSDGVITIIAYRGRQLNDIILDNRIKENRQLLDSEVVGIDEVNLQAVKYIEKIIPLANRFILPSGLPLINGQFYKLIRNIEGELSDEEIVKEYYQKIFSEIKIEDVNSYKDISIQEWIYASVYNRTRLRIEPIETNENTILNSPQNLRGLVQLIKLIQEELENIPTLNKNEGVESEEIFIIINSLLKNVKKYKIYMINSAKEHFTGKEIEFIEKLEDETSDEKNHYIYSELSSRIVKSIYNSYDKDEANKRINKYQILNMGYVQNYNITLLDVYQIIDLYKTEMERTLLNRYLSYVVKVFLSIDLLESLLDSLAIIFTDKTDEDIDRDDLKGYFDLTNSKIFDEESVRFAGWRWTYRSEDYIFNDVDSENIIKYFAYSSMSEGGDTRRDALIKIGESINTYSQSLKFYPAYDLEEDDTFSRKRGRYPLNPFSYFLKTEYYNFAIKQNMRECYLFYSLFDLDVFNTINYARKSEKTPFKKVISKINNIFSNNNVYTSRERKIMNLICKNPFYQEKIDQKYRYLPFDDESIRLAGELSNEKMFSRNKEYYEKLDSIRDRLADGERSKKKYLEIINELQKNFWDDMTMDDHQESDRIKKYLERNKTRMSQENIEKLEAIVYSLGE